MSPRASVRHLWAVLLAGPVIGTLYFFTVYLAAEVACADDAYAVSTSALRAIMLVAAAASVAVGIAAASRARTLFREASKTNQHGDTGEPEDNTRFMGSTALILLGLFLFFVAAVAGATTGTTLC